jgi:hypothetical protein
MGEKNQVEFQVEVHYYLALFQLQHNLAATFATADIRMRRVAA